MGIDLRVITGHRLSAKQIMDFPDWLEKQQQLKELFILHMDSKLDFGYQPEKIWELLQRKSFWEPDCTEKDLLNSWENKENPDLLHQNGFIAYSLSTYFGIIYFNRTTIEIMYFPEHKYSNLRDENQRSFILTFSRAFARTLGQNQVVYCSDTFESEYIEDLAMEGKNLETIIRLGIERLGKPPKTIREAIENRFFIDDLEDPLLLE